MQASHVDAAVIQHLVLVELAFLLFKLNPFSYDDTSQFRQFAISLPMYGKNKEGKRGKSAVTTPLPSKLQGC